MRMHTNTNTHTRTRTYWTAVCFLFRVINMQFKNRSLVTEVSTYVHNVPATMYGWTILSQWASLIGISLKSLLWHIHGESLCCAAVSGLFPTYLAGRFKQVLFAGLYISIYRTPGLRDGSDALSIWDPLMVFYSARTRFHSVVEDRTLDLRW
jgi:hypothetical protein